MLCGRWAWKREQTAASWGWRRPQKELKERELGDYAGRACMAVRRWRGGGGQSCDRRSEVAETAWGSPVQGTQAGLALDRSTRKNV